MRTRRWLIADLAREERVLDMAFFSFQHQFADFIEIGGIGVERTICAMSRKNK